MDCGHSEILKYRRGFLNILISQTDYSSQKLVVYLALSFLCLRSWILSRVRKHSSLYVVKWEPECYSESPFDEPFLQVVSGCMYIEPLASRIYISCCLSIKLLKIGRESTTECYQSTHTGPNSSCCLGVPLVGSKYVWGCAKRTVRSYLRLPYVIKHSSIMATYILCGHLC